MKNINNFLLEPEININKYFNSIKNNNYSVFEFEYLPDINIMNTNFSMTFKMNINNYQDVYINLTKPDNYKIKFKFLKKIKVIYLDNLNSLPKVIGEYIINNLNK